MRVLLVVPDDEPRRELAAQLKRFPTSSSRGRLQPFLTWMSSCGPFVFKNPIF